MSKSIELTSSQIKAFETGATMFIFSITDYDQRRIESGYSIGDSLPVWKGDKDVWIKEEFQDAEQSSVSDNPIPLYFKIRELLDYNEDTGIFAWKKNNKIAGTKHSAGYTVITIDKVKYYAHRLAWIYMNGEEAKEQIDHINHDRNDNRFNNLRESSIHENGKNKSIYINNKSGVNGVAFIEDRNRWRASTRTNGVSINLGYFKTKEEAIKAREKHNKEHIFHENHGKPRYYFKEVLDVRVVRVQDLEIKEMQKVTGNNGVEITKPYAEFYNQQMKEIGLERTYQDNDYVFLIETTIT